MGQKIKHARFGEEKMWVIFYGFFTSCLDFLPFVMKNCDRKTDERIPNVTLLSFMEKQDHLIVLLFVENLSCEK